MNDGLWIIEMASLTTGLYFACKLTYRSFRQYFRLRDRRLTTR